MTVSASVFLLVARSASNPAQQTVYGVSYNFQGSKMSEPEKLVEDPPAQPETQPADNPAVDPSPPAVTEPPEPTEGTAPPEPATIPTEPAELTEPAAEVAQVVQEPVTGGDAANNSPSDVPPTTTQVDTGEIPPPASTEPPPAETTTNPDSIEIKENEVTVEDEKSAVDFLLGDDQKRNVKDSIASNVEQIPGTEGNNLESTRSVTSEVLTEVDYSVQTALADADETGEPEDSAILEKQPAIGQLQLKELLSGTSIKIVEHAQKLAEAPLIGTIVPPQDPPPGSAALPQAEPSQIPPSSRSSRTVPGTRVEEKPAAEGRTQEGEGEDRFPGPDYDDGSRSVAPPSDMHPLLLQDPEVQSDVEPYEMYTIPESADKEDELPAILRRYMRNYQDDKEPVAKMFKMEDEDKLNEAAAWDILPNYKTSPDCQIRVSILEKILKGILHYRITKLSDAKPSKLNLLSQILCEDVASTLSTLNFPRYKYGYFITVIPKTSQDVIVSTRQLWDPVTDRRVIAKFDTQHFHASVVVHFIYHP